MIQSGGEADGQLSACFNKLNKWIHYLVWWTPEEFKYLKMSARLSLGLVSSLWSAQVRCRSLLWCNLSSEIKKGFCFRLYLDAYFLTFFLSTQWPVMPQIWHGQEQTLLYFGPFVCFSLYSQVINSTAVRDWNMPEINVDLELLSAVWNIFSLTAFLAVLL